jgi:hypothetical protein
MIKLIINNTAVEAPEGSTLLQAAALLGIEIPTLCYNGNLEHFTSCMLCLVKDNKNGRLIPSCSAKALEGMDIITGDEEIMESRKMALELLMSEHAGDCEAPCRVACPAFMDIPVMNRLIAAGKTDEALQVVMKDIALPGILGRICPAPCEGACKRKSIDEAISVCLLKRFSADAGALPTFVAAAATGKKVAVIGAGPAGLSAAFYLQLKGITVEVFDSGEKPGGSLNYVIPETVLERKVIEQEAAVIERLGVVFHQNTLIDAVTFERLRKDYDAVVIATGNFNASMAAWGISNNGKQVLVDKATYQTNLPGVFAIGNVNRSMQLAIRSAAQGKEVAIVIEQLFSGEKPVGERRKFNSTLGRLVKEEYHEYLQEGTSEGRHKPAAEGAGFVTLDAQKEAARCLHCDCRKPTSCLLRKYATEFDIAKKRFNYSDRKPVKKIIRQDVLVYEPGKCIRCGICVRLTAQEKERYGFTFIGRGFDVELGVPFDYDLAAAFEKTAGMVADACPTAALARHLTTDYTD